MRLKGWIFFDELSGNLGGFREKIARGSFADTIKSADIRCLLNHDVNYVIGRTANGTLMLREEEKGLYFEAIPGNSQWEKDLVAKIKRRDISNNSFGFLIQDEEWSYARGEAVRTLKKVELFDVSAVTFPAYSGSRVFVEDD